MSHGKQVNDILVIEPTTTAWMYVDVARRSQRFLEIGSTFQDAPAVKEFSIII